MELFYILIHFNCILIRFYISKKDSPWESLRQHCLELFWEMWTGELRSVSTVMSSLSKGGDWIRALELMRSSEAFNASNASNASNDSKDSKDRLHCHTALLSAFRRGQALDLGLKYARLHSLHRDLDAVGYDTLLALCDAWREAFNVLELMQQKALEPSIFGLFSLFKAAEKAPKEALQKHFLDHIKLKALEILSELREGQCTESQLVHLVLAVDLLKDPTLDKIFEEKIFFPTLKSLESLEKSSQTTALPGLGWRFTMEALNHMGLKAEGPWREKASQIKS